MQYIEQSEEITGYKVKIMQREAFKVTGYTIIVPPTPSDNMIGQFWDDAIANGRLDRLKKASAVPTWVLGLGSWDPECEKRGSRYTICIEETEHTDLVRLRQDYPLFTREIGASEWMCFEMTLGRFKERFWRDNPYKMIPKLGYQFYTREGDFSVGLHIEAFPPECSFQADSAMEFWITVEKP